MSVSTTSSSAAGAVAAPVSLPGDWQSQLRAQKQQERQKKAETAQMHRGYRGGVREEDMKLAALKEQERRRKLETEQMLRGYRGSLTGEDLKLAAMRQEERKRLQDAEEMWHSYRGADLAADAARSPRAMPSPKKNYPTPVNVSKDEADDPLAAISPGAVSSLAASFTGPAPKMQQAYVSPSRTRNKQFGPVSAAAVVPDAAAREHASAQASIGFPNIHSDEETDPNVSSEIGRTEALDEVKSGEAEPAQVARTAASLLGTDACVSTETPSGQATIENEVISAPGQSAFEEEIFQQPTEKPAAEDGPYPSMAKEQSAVETDVPEKPSKGVEPSLEQEKSPATIAPQPPAESQTFEPAAAATTGDSQLDPPPGRGEEAQTTSPEASVFPAASQVLEEKKVDSQEEALLHEPQERQADSTKDLSHTEREEKPMQLQEELVTPHRSTQQPSILRLDVHFSFGLVTFEDTPNLYGYMQAVDHVVRTTLSIVGGDQQQTKEEQISYDPANHGPVVRECTYDDLFDDPQGRPNVKRIVVIACVPIFSMSAASSRNARKSIVAALQASIASGEFRAIAAHAVVQEGYHHQE